MMLIQIKKTAYTQAVTNAENILNKNSGSNLDKTAVDVTKTC